MARGDHIYVWRSGFTHHGIDCGGGIVIHYSGELFQKSNTAIKQTSMTEFAQGGQIHIQTYSKCYLPNMVIERAESRLRLRENKYNIAFNNCEHFATWCKTGKHESKQVNEMAEAIGKGIGDAIGKILGG